jgi:hypothetical protein
VRWLHGHADSVASPVQNINSILHPSEIEQLSDLQGYLNFAPAPEESRRAKLLVSAIAKIDMLGKLAAAMPTWL